MKLKSKNIAIELRKKGLSYNQIRNKVPVSKSTLSLWLRSVALSKLQKQKLTIKRLEAMKKGWETQRSIRVQRTDRIKEKAQKDIKKRKISDRELFFMGLMLYWAEGAKQKEYNVSEGVIFSNSDSKMVALFLLWLRKSLKIPENRIRVDVYLHINHDYRSDEVINYWIRATGISEAQFGKIYFKRNISTTKRKNVGESYFGLLRVKVKRSTDLNREIAGWIEGIHV